MRGIVLAVGGIAAIWCMAATLAHAEPNVLQGTSLDFNESLWDIRAGAVILNRSGPVLSAPPTTSVSNVSDFDWIGGPDIYVARRITDTDSIEARYFSVIGWSAEYDYTDPVLFFNGTYDASLYSTEVNVRRQHTDRVAFLAGFRWLELHELMNNADRFSSFAFATRTANYLYGAQAGVDAILWDRGGPFRIEGNAKAGIYGTVAQAHYTNTAGFNDVANDSLVSFVGDMAFTAVYQFTDRIALRAGYQLLWMQGVALAGDQLQFSQDVPPLPLDTLGGMFAHGALVGMELTW